MNESDFLLKQKSGNLIAKPKKEKRNQIIKLRKKKMKQGKKEVLNKDAANKPLFNLYMKMNRKYIQKGQIISRNQCWVAKFFMLEKKKEYIHLEEM